jgi:hypothetical protein
MSRAQHERTQARHVSYIDGEYDKLVEIHENSLETNRRR